MNVENAEPVEVTVDLVDEERDVALLSGNVSSKRSALSCKPVEIGQRLEIVGNPLGINFIHTWGRVAGAARDVDGKTVFIMDASVGPGNSGGPVFNERGEVIGVVIALITADLSPAPFPVPTTIGLAAAVPSSVICGLIEKRHRVVAPGV